MVWASGGGTIKISLAIGFPWRNAELMSILFKSHCLLDTMASVIRKHSLLPVGESDCIDDFSWKPLIKYLVFSCVILLFYLTSTYPSSRETYLSDIFNFSVDIILLPFVNFCLICFTKFSWVPCFKSQIHIINWLSS